MQMAVECLLKASREVLRGQRPCDRGCRDCIPPLRDGVCRCCSGGRGLTCTQRGRPLPIPRFAAYSSGVSSRRVLHRRHCCFCSSKALYHPTSLCGCLGVGALGGGGESCFAGGAVRN
ncbi:hypothetical protein NQZ68_040816 [Dissostichus eleginoides]|nr:hypothetical protein NQZ68_040816 [Dissostichus eleginoides]